MSSIARRRKELSKYVNLTKAHGLEIGPLDAPLITKKEGNVKYLDYLSYDELVKRHSARRDADKIVPPDYVISSDQPLTSLVKERFDYIIACHVIEHIPNTVAWLNDLRGLLNERGYLFLVVPDKRYTFDILRPETTLAHVLNDYFRDIKVPELEHVFEHFFLKRELSSREIWSNDFQEKLSCQRYTVNQAYTMAVQKIRDSGYVDVHCHVYTYESFKDLMNSLIELKVIKYCILGSQDVVKPYNEFFMTLQKC